MQQFFERDLQFHSPEMDPGTIVRPPPEGEMLADVLPIEDERVAVREQGLVAVRRGVDQRDRLALANEPATDLDVARRRAGEAADRRIEPQELLPRRRTQRKVGAQSRLQGLDLRKMDGHV